MVLPKLRKPVFSFADVPRHWFFQSAFATHMANGLNLLFPLGERFFVRSVRAYQDQIDADPELRERVRAFIGQEVRHGMEHEHFFEVIEQHGFEIRSYLAWYEKLAYRGLEAHVPKSLNLAVTVALEHFTAMFAERALERDLLKDHAHPTLRDLLLWHACEEIEHKSVAFDVLQKVDPRYSTRILGLLFGASALVFFWMAATHHLLAQEPADVRQTARRDFFTKRGENALFNGEFLQAFRAYLRPNFHPTQCSNEQLAQGWLIANAERLGMVA